MKKEFVFEEILNGFVVGKKTVFTQQALAKLLGISLSTVSNALKPLVKMGAVDVRPRGFRVLDAQKIMLYWASVRDLRKHVLYATRVEAGVSETEKSMPAGVVFSAYSGYKFRFGDVPADYSEVYVYAPKSGLEEIRGRFPAKKGAPNLFVLEADEELERTAENAIASTPRIFADLWNLREWYAKEFVKSLEARLGW